MKELALWIPRLLAAGILLPMGYRKLVGDDMSVMLGAIIAHTTVLGADVGGDGGRLLVLLVTVFVSAMTVLVARRRDLPLVGSTLDGRGDERVP